MTGQGFWETSLNWVAENAPAIYAGLAAIGVSSMMSIRDGKPKKYTITSAIVCGIIGMSLSGLMTHVGLPSNAASLVGGIVGFLGADKLRDLANSLVHRRSCGPHQEESNNEENQ